MKLPSFEQLKRNYPTDHSAAAVMHAIGGGIANLSPDTNTCVMRMSRAFNYAGKQLELPKYVAHPRLRTISDADHKHYAYNVQGFIAFLKHRYGLPSLSKRYTAAEMELAEPFLNRTGIIAWQIHGWDDATGHFALWDGTTGLYEGSHDYFTSFPYVVTDEDGTKRTMRDTGADLWMCCVPCRPPPHRSPLHPSPGRSRRLSKQPKHSSQTDCSAPRPRSDGSKSHPAVRKPSLRPSSQSGASPHTRHR